MDVERVLSYIRRSAILELDVFVFSTHRKEDDTRNNRTDNRTNDYTAEDILDNRTYA